jgi:hypothetical protein
LHDRVDVPEPPAIDDAVRTQARLVELVVTIKVTVPTNPFREAILIVEFPRAPALTIKDAGLGVIVKSVVVTRKTTLTE